VAEDAAASASQPPSCSGAQVSEARRPLAQTAQTGRRLSCFSRRSGSSTLRRLSWTLVYVHRMSVTGIRTVLGRNVPFPAALPTLVLAKGTLGRTADTSPLPPLEKGGNCVYEPSSRPCVPFARFILDLAKVACLKEPSSANVLSRS
jgi:hypothetical protein